MDEIEEIETFRGLLAFCNYCGTSVDPLRRLVHLREEKHRELTSTGLQCFEDKLLLLKGDLLSQTEEEFSAVKDLILTAEKTLKIVSDEFLKKAEEEAKKKREEKDSSDDDDGDDDEDSSSDDSDDENKTPVSQKRIVRGVMRVGPLANGLLLRGGTEVGLVILCEEKPTRKLLKELYECFSTSLTLLNGSQKKFEVELKEEESCFHVRLTEGSVRSTCTVGLTCTKCRLHPFKAFNEKLPLDPVDMLPRVKCEEMLRLSRRARWFESKCYFHHHSEVALKVLGDLCRREEVFRVIDDWLLQMLFHKVISSPDNSSINLIGIFQRFFECLSSGILLPDGPGLYDPCEREPHDLRDQLTLQQKLNITTTAQKMLRMIASKQLQTILGLSREDIENSLKPMLGPMKRKNSESGNGESPERKRRS